MYKVRLRGESSGKSGGYRLLTCVLEYKKLLIPICIYPKSKKENVSGEELAIHIREIQKELGMIW